MTTTGYDQGGLAMGRNNETLKENLYHLEESLKCARLNNWYGAEHFLHIYLEQKRKRLASRLRLKEQYSIETCQNPHTEQEHALFTELFGLTTTFLGAAGEREAQLIAKFHEEPTAPRQANVFQFRNEVTICLHVRKWLVGQKKRETRNG